MTSVQAARAITPHAHMPLAAPGPPEAASRRRRHLRLPAAALTATIAAVIVAGVPTAATAAAPLRVGVSAKTVEVGDSVVVRVRGTTARCRLSVRKDRPGALATYRRSIRRSLRLIVPLNSAAGPRIVTVRCGRRSASARYVVTGSNVSPTDHGELYSSGDGLPDGEGDPSQYEVAGAKDAGGAGFGSYWPFATGFRALITQGQGGGFSHTSVYTRDAVDLGVGRGTEIRAGFTGVVARVSRGCVEGNKQCGNGYGNYLYLKATDGSCALFAHLSSVAVNLGQQVAQYAVVGTSGNTGSSSGPHLHFNRVDCVNNRSLPWQPLEGGPMQYGATITSGNAPLGPASAPPAAPAPPAPAPQPATRQITVDNRVTNGASAMREDTPAYLSTVTRNYCKRDGCALAGTDIGSGAVLVAECTTIGTRTTNGQDGSSVDDGNPGLYSSTRWYGVRWGDGRFGYISEVWIRSADRGGLGLRAC